MTLKLDGIGGADVSAEAFENGVFCHLLDDDGNKKFLENDQNKPMGAVLRSMRSKAVQQAELTLQQKRQTVGRGRRRQKQGGVPTAEYLAHVVSAAVVSLHNFSREAAVQIPTQAELYSFLMLPQNQWIAEDFWGFADEDANFIGVSGNGLPPTAEPEKPPTSPGLSNGS